MISTPVALLVLLAALLHAGWNFMIKASSDRLLDTVALTLCASLLAACLMPFVPLPHAASWPWLFATLVLHIGYFSLLIAAYQHADLSLAYPLMRGTAPLLVAAVSPLFGEPAKGGLLFGAALVGAGITLPAWIGIRRGLVRGKAIKFALGNSLIIASYTISDGFGVRLAGNTLSYVVWLFFLNAWGILAYVCYHQGGAVFVHLRRRWAHAVGGALLTVGAYGIALWAMTMAPLAAVAALRETSVIFAAILGATLLKESLGVWRILGAIAVGVGVVLVKVQT